MRTMSVAEAKNKLPAAIHDAEDGEDIGITRYGQPVAVLVSHDRYRALAAKPGGFREALHAFLAEPADSEGLLLRDGEVDSWRDRRPPPARNPYE